MIRDASRIRRLTDAPTIGEIREQLQLAIEIEHATIPAYLTALFTLKDGTNHAPSWVIRSVAIEEMLHMTLASNILNAIGGHPAIANPDFVAEYPTTLPHFIASPYVQIEPFTRDALRTFLRIEWRATDEERDRTAEAEGRYRTIGEFYGAIEEGLRRLVGESGEPAVFSGDPSRQVAGEDYYGSEGEVIQVTGLESAIAAIELIVEQGEGDHGMGPDAEGDPRREESSDEYFHAVPGAERYVAHLYRFYELYRGRYYHHDEPQRPPNLDEPEPEVVDADEGDEARFSTLPLPTGLLLPVDYEAVWPIGKNPKAAHYARGSEIRAKLETFNRTYTELLQVLDRTFNGEPSLLKLTVPKMYELEYLGRDLCRTPSGDGRTTVGPSWEFVDG